MSDNTANPTDTTPSRDFVRAIVAADVSAGTHDGRVTTRFPPEPNGYLHIGHAKSIVLNFGIAQDHEKGACHLRFDDSNPETEDTEYVESIQGDVRWLGYDWGDKLFHASSYFEKLYAYAVQLIEAGKAYVCSLDDEAIRAYRGTVTEAGKASPYRERSVEENVTMFARMRAGDFPDGAHVLRAKIDMAASNMKLRDPLLYRIRHATHHRTGNEWCIYPMYDFAHCLSDSIEGITHSVCTLEFENNRAVYDWVLDNLPVQQPRPHQYEFARLNLTYTVLSKRRLRELVEAKLVEGWDDPRLPTLAGLRRRGYTPAAIRQFCERIGVAKANSVVDVGQLEFSVRDALNHEAPRVLCVLRPLKVVLTNYPESTEFLDASYWPHDVPKEGSRQLPFTRELYIEQDDFMEVPVKGYHRLAPGREVRLRYAYFITCNEVVKNSAGEVVELRCTYDPNSQGGNAADGRKVKGTLHWVSAKNCVNVEARVYDRLFLDPTPDGHKEKDFKEYLNPESLVVLPGAKGEASLAKAKPGQHFQFERQGFFIVDADTTTGGDTSAPVVFNRVVPLRDSWGKPTSAVADDAPTTATKSAGKTGSKKSANKKPHTQRAAMTDTPELCRYRDELGLSQEDAEQLVSRSELAPFFETAVAAHNNPQAIANWLINDILRQLKEQPLSELKFDGAALGELVKLIDAGTISSKIAKEVFAAMLSEGDSPADIVKARGLEQIADPAVLGPIVESVIAGQADMVARYKGGNAKVFGSFVGKVMQETKGKANPQLVNSLLREKLDPEP